MKRFYESLLDKVSVRGLGIICGIVLFISAIAMTQWVVHRLQQIEPFGGQEVVEAHVTADGKIRAFSRICITSIDTGYSHIPLTLPQPGATLESVTIGGREAAFVPNPDKEDAYAVMHSLPKKALMNALLEVVWSIPLADTNAGDNCPRFPLKGVIPVKAYAVNFVLDDDAPYRFGGKFAHARSINAFWSQQPRYTACQMGYCGLGLLPRENPVAEVTHAP
jgi:hypothetical protein